MSLDTEIKNNENDTLRSLCRELTHGFVFWSLFQGLGPMIWFYPLNELEISGYEIFAAVYFSPILLGFPFILPVIQNRWVLGILRVLVVTSLGSFQMKTTLQRLIVLALGTGTAMWVFVATFWSPCRRIRTNTFWGLMLGLMLFITSRIWLISFVPTWWSNHSNSLVISLGIIAAIDQLLTGADDGVTEKETNVPKVTRPHWLPTALGFGSLLYLTHWCFGEVSLISRWVVKGYPNNGPLPYPWGALVLLSLSFGVYMSSCRHMARSKGWWLCGLAAFGALYYLPTWQGYLGGLMLAMYTMSVWPEMMDRLTLCPPARTLFVVMVTYLVEIFFQVWTVAYNFVPGGVYTREHTDFLMVAVMVGIFLGLFVGGAINESHTASAEINNNKMPSTKALFVLVLITCSGFTGFAVRYTSQPYNLQQKTTKPSGFTAMIWTYHFGYDNKGWPSLERSASLLKETDADVITLLESDASKPFLGNNDLSMWLGEKLGMYVDFGPATKDHTWGNLILSKYPFVKSKHHLLPSPHGELAPAITATVNMTGQLVDFVVTHMGNDRDVLDRKLQAEFLARELNECVNPVVFLGYVTSAPGSREYNYLLKKGQVKDIDATDTDRWCEYIMYRGLRRLGYARVTHGGLSDTEVQLGKFEFPENPNQFKDNDKIITNPKTIDESVRFSKSFGSYHQGHGYFKGHKFHMSTPKYFLPST